MNVCEFCENGKKLLNTEGLESYLKISEHMGEYRIRYAGIGAQREEAVIKFCPICGRKLYRFHFGKRDIDGLVFVMVSKSFPEQHEVFSVDGEMVGYLRLRLGVLECIVPDEDGEVIYSNSIGDVWCGAFPDEDDRTFHLKEVAKHLKERLRWGERYED